MRVAITGATGFVGRHVLAALQRHDIDLVVTTRSPAAPASDDRVEIVRMDLADPGPDPFVQLGSPDILVHLAWDGLPHYQSPRHVDIELPAQVAFLDACINGGLPRLVVTGTCFEYGLQSGELSETMPAAPVTAYGSAKDQLRRHLESRQRDRDFDLAWLRLFYVFGDGQAPTSLYSQLQAAIRRDAPSFDMSPGDQVRDFLPIADAATLIARIALLTGDTGIVNLCSGQPVAVAGLVRDWLASAGATMALNLGHFPYPATEPMSFWGSRRKIQTLLGDS